MLGQTLSPDGSVRTCQDLVLRGAWRAFWANLGGKKGRSLPCKMKLDLIDRAVAPVIFFRVLDGLSLNALQENLTSRKDGWCVM